MIHGNCKAIWQKAAVTKAVEKGGVKALNKAAAYMRGVARRKVKRRKHKSSPPGSPPYAHSGVFKAAILHAVDPMNIASYVGPQRLVTHRTNYAGQPVPEILEFGGMAALGMNQNWIHKKAPRGVNSKSSIASYFKSIGTGPLHGGTVRHRQMPEGRRQRPEDAAAAGHARAVSTRNATRQSCGKKSILPIFRSEQTVRRRKLPRRWSRSSDTLLPTGL